MNSLDRILVVLGEKDDTQPALDYAQSLAAANDAKLIAVDVKPYLDAYTKALVDIMPKDELRSLVLDNRRKQLQRLLENHDTIESETAEAKVLDGVPFIEIIREVLRNQHSLIIKVAEGNVSPHDRIFGSTDMHLMRKSPVPVLVLNPERLVPAKRVLVAVDVLADDAESQSFNRRILDLARSIVDVSDAEFHLLSAWRLVGEDTMRHSPFLKISDDRVEQMLIDLREQLNRRQTEILEWYSTTYPNSRSPVLHSVKGEARQAIQSFVTDHSIDLVVMGTVGRAGIPGLLIGNTAESVLSEVNCSVLTVKPEGFLTPVAGG